MLATPGIKLFCSNNVSGTVVQLNQQIKELWQVRRVSMYVIVTEYTATLDFLYAVQKQYSSCRTRNFVFVCRKVVIWPLHGANNIEVSGEYGANLQKNEAKKRCFRPAKTRPYLFSLVIL